LKTDIANLMFCFLQKFVSKQLTVAFPATPVIVSTAVPHSYQYEHHTQELN